MKILRNIIEIGFATTALILVAFFLSYACPTNFDLPAWVQAFGSIGAIIGAFAVSNNQHKKEKLLEIKKEAYEREKRYALVSGILRNVRKQLKTAAEYRDNNDFVIADEEHVRQLRASASLIAALPPFDMPGAKILMLCLAIGDKIPLTADILDKERVDLLARRGRPDGVEDSIDSLFNALNQAITVCGSLSPSLTLD